MNDRNRRSAAIVDGAAVMVVSLYMVLLMAGAGLGLMRLVTALGGVG